MAMTADGLVLSPAYLSEHGRFLRLFVLAALSEMTRHGFNSRPCLFMLDEFFSLGLDSMVTGTGRPDPPRPRSCYRLISPIVG